MRVILMVGAVLALSACGGGETETEEANMMATDNMMMDQNLAMDPMMNMDANMAVDPATENMIAEDMNTNDPDTNLANGL